jgi:hypothetical protein
MLYLVKHLKMQRKVAQEDLQGQSGKQQADHLVKALSQLLKELFLPVEERSFS